MLRKAKHFTGTTATIPVTSIHHSHIQLPHHIDIMADVDMDVDPPATKGKKDGKDAGKPRFEVKKVQSCYLERPPQCHV